MATAGQSPATRLVVGLGNPGDEYDGTRHNVGYDVVDRVAAFDDRPFLRRGRSLVARGERGGGVYLLAKPLTYMNRSGRAVRDLLADLEGPVDVLVVCDDFHLPLAKLRCRLKGSAGGQNGLASVIEHVSAVDPKRQVPRLRFGIGDPGRIPAEDFVLLRFRRGELEAVAEGAERAAAHVHDWLEHGDLDRLMRDCNAG